MIRHVLAAAVRAGAQAIVTFNLKDFPEAELARYDIEPKHPDEFLMNCIDISAPTVIQILTEQAGTTTQEPECHGSRSCSRRFEGMAWSSRSRS